MKINSFIAVATFLLVITYFWVLRIQPDEPSDMTKCIPSTALAYFEQHNFARSSESFATSSLGRRVQSIDFVSVLQEIGATEEIAAGFSNLEESIKSIYNDPLIGAICGNRFALTLLPPPVGSPESSLGNKNLFLENLVIIATPQHFLGGLGSLAAILEDSGGVALQTKVQYGRHQIIRMVSKGQTFSLVVLDDLFLIGVNERQVRRCIDAFDGDIPSFSDNTELIAFKKSLPAFDSFLVLPFKNIVEYLPALFGDPDFSGRTSFFRESLLVGIRGFFYGAKRQESILKEQILVHYDPEARGGLLRDQLLTKPIKPGKIFLSSPNPMFYLWSNSFDVQNIFNLAGDGIKEGGGDADIDHHVESSANGKDFRNLVMFGKEITVIAEQGADESPFPLPLTMIFIPVTDKESLKLIVQETLHAYDIPVNTDEYDSVEYTYWSQSQQDGLIPVYGFWGEYFFLGNSRILLEKIIDASKSDLSLLSIESIKKNDPGVAEKNNLLIFKNNKKVAQIFEIVFKTVGTIAAIENRELAQMAQVVVDKIILPLLEEEKMFDTSVTRSYFPPEMIVIDTISNISIPLADQGMKNE